MASVTFPPSLGGDGSTVTDDRDPTTGLRGGGYRTRFVPALSQFVTVAQGAIDDTTAAGAAQVALAAAQVALASDEADRSELAADISVGAANYRGEYSAITTYTVGQSVSYLGGQFVAKKTNLGITPVDGVDWLELASADTGLIPSPVIENFRATRTFANGAANSPAQVIAIDADRELLVYANGHAIVYNKTTATLGTVVSYRATTNINFLYALLIDTNKVLLVSVPSSAATALQWVVLSISGETITVGSPTSTTLSAGLNSNNCQLITVGTSYVLSLAVLTPAKQLYAATVSGTTVTVGSALVLSGALGTPATIEAVTSGVLIAFHSVSGTGYATPVSVSGTTLTGGTEATLAISGTGHYSFGILSTGRWLVLYGSTGIATLVSVSGTTATMSATVTTSLNLSGAEALTRPFLKQTDAVIFVASGTVAQRLRDSAGTITSATLTVPNGLTSAVKTANSLVVLIASVGFSYKVTFSSGEPLLTRFEGVVAISPTTVSGFNAYGLFFTTTTIVNGEAVATTANSVSEYTDGTNTWHYYAKFPLSNVSFPAVATPDGSFTWTAFTPDPAVANSQTIVRYSL